MMYDYLIVGSGLYGSVLAHELTKAGKRCLIIEKRNHIGGNIYTREWEGIHIHQYGAHIFHTDNKLVWDYVNEFVEFNNYVNSPIANYNGELYNLPFNMNTFYQMWGAKTPDEAREIIEKQRKDNFTDEPKNLKEQAINLVGKDIFEKLIEGYTEKQWGRSCSELPAFIIKRLPVRFTFNNNYFNHPYQGIPKKGYTYLIEKLIENIDVKTNTDYLENRDYWNSQASKIIYTGPIDAFFDYKLGTLEYRKVRFDTQYLDIPNFQGNAVVNYTDKSTPYTRIIEHKHFNFGQQPKTVISYEYSEEWSLGDEPYYPINDTKNNELYRQYKALADTLPDVHIGGRLGEYRYYDMDKTVAAALSQVESMID
ncbi:UDP-galactopyranose mutase [Spirochaeta cellobiosiphila]|uniref:UDP-galactopyranose mutase n=1 Tax=Spirochaeta cellobiosiphila TaxID=504483 RepID=UPI0005690D3A|nr:UDP-galactopyranose mutase [Spirochaeta cellobiosiphila]